MKLQTRLKLRRGEKPGLFTPDVSTDPQCILLLETTALCCLRGVSFARPSWLTPRTPAGLVLTIGLVGVAAAFVATWNPRGDFWDGVEPPKAQCEAYQPEMLTSLPSASMELYDPRALDRLFREPQNTVSNLAYACVAWMVLTTSAGASSRSFALACLFLAFGSGIYHASLLPEWRLIDIMGVYAALATLLAHGCWKQTRRRPSGVALMAMGAVWLAAVWCAIHRNDFRCWGFKPLDSKTVVVAFVAITSLLALAAVWRARRPLRTALALRAAAVAVLAPLAFAGGLGDRFHGFWADPNALIQGHTVWHTAGALALLLVHDLFTHARSESVPE